MAAGFFNGAIDEGRIWDRALTPAEIRAQINTQLTSASNLVARWGLNEGIGTSVFDSTANPANGTIVGTGFTWTSNAPFDLNLPPTVTGPGDQTSTEGAVMSLQVAATDPNPLDILTYSAGNLPSGLAINPATGEIGGTISTTAGSGSPYSVVITATDNGTPARSGQATFTWNVTDVNQAPSVTNPGDQTTAEGTNISLQISATDADQGQTLTYSATDLPGGLSIDSGTGLISGTASFTASTGSPYVVMVTATDNGAPVLAAHVTFNWNVANANGAPVVTNPGGQIDNAGDVVMMSIGASDPDGDGLTFGATGLPAGLSIDAGGSITGTIGAGAAVGSPYTVTVTVSDAAVPPASTAVVFNWTVVAPGANFALDFDGSNDHVSFVSSSFLGVSTFTIEAWINRQGAGVGADTGKGGIPAAIPIVTKGTSEVDQQDNRDMNYFIGLDATTGVLVADFEEGAAGASPSLNHPAFGTTIIPMDTWTHVAVTYDGTAWRLYVNGVLDGTVMVGQPPRADSIQPFGIGTVFESDLSPEGFFDGIIDEVRIWDHARSAQEILDDLERPLTSGSGLVRAVGIRRKRGRRAQRFGRRRSRRCAERCNLGRGNAVRRGADVCLRARTTLSWPPAMCLRTSPLSAYRRPVHRGARRHAIVCDDRTLQRCGIRKRQGLVAARGDCRSSVFRCGKRRTAHQMPTRSDDSAGEASACGVRDGEVVAGLGRFIEIPPSEQPGGSRYRSGCAAQNLFRAARIAPDARFIDDAVEESPRGPRGFQHVAGFRRRHVGTSIQDAWHSSLASVHEALDADPAHDAPAGHDPGNRAYTRRGARRGDAAARSAAEAHASSLRAMRAARLEA